MLACKVMKIVTTSIDVHAIYVSVYPQEICANVQFERVLTEGQGTDMITTCMCKRLKR